MHTADQILIIVASSLISIFFLLCIVAVFAVLKLIKALREMVAKAEEVVDNVESAAEVLKDTSGRMATIKLIRNIMKIMQGKK